MVSFNRSKFLEMCDGLLARVEAPLRSVLEQASKCVCICVQRDGVPSADFFGC